MPIIVTPMLWQLVMTITSLRALLIAFPDCRFYILVTSLIGRSLVMRLSVCGQTAYLVGFLHTERAFGRPVFAIIMVHIASIGATPIKVFSW